MSSAMHSKIQEIAQHNVVLHNSMRMSEYGQCSYEEALQMAVIQLVAVNDSQQKTILDFAMRQPAPILMGVSK